MRKIIIAGASSSSGKTTIACGLLSVLRKRGLTVSAYKTGPDYIDPQYLRRAGNCEAYNLDTWLMNENLTRKLFMMTSADKDFAIIEGAMGLYDGGINSTAGIAKLLKAPVILVINAKSLGESAAAIALGFRELDHEINIAGVILNCTGSSSHEKIIADALERVNIKFLGALRRNKELAIPERHLGLLPELENESFDFEALTSEIKRNIDIDEIIRISETSFDDTAKISQDISRLKSEKLFIPEAEHKVTVAIARDEAFSFYYPESLEMLKLFGAQLIFFSPLHDEKLPEAEIYIFGGGFPEVFARELAENISMLESVRNCEKKIYAECGGFMYLCRSLDNYKLAGLIPCNAFMTKKPVIGYVEARALKSNIICETGKIIRGHEFHYSRIYGEVRSDETHGESKIIHGFHYSSVDDEARSDETRGESKIIHEVCNDATRVEGKINEESEKNFVPAFEFVRKRTGEKYYGGYSHGKILASYLHINFFGNPELAEKFLTSS